MPHQLLDFVRILCNWGATHGGVGRNAGANALQEGLHDALNKQIEFDMFSQFKGQFNDMSVVHCYGSSAAVIRSESEGKHGQQIRVKCGIL